MFRGGLWQKFCYVLVALALVAIAMPASIIGVLKSFASGR